MATLAFSLDLSRPVISNAVISWRQIFLGTVLGLWARVAFEHTGHFPQLLWQCSDTVPQRVIPTESLQNFFYSFSISHHIRRVGVKLRACHSVGFGLALAEYWFPSYSQKEYAALHLSPLIPRGLFPEGKFSVTVEFAFRGTKQILSVIFPIPPPPFFTSMYLSFIQDLWA